MNPTPDAEGLDNIQLEQTSGGLLVRVVYGAETIVQGPLSFGLSTLPESFNATILLSGFSVKENVVAGLAENPGGTGSALQRIVARAAEQDVVAASRPQRVVAVVATHLDPDGFARPIDVIIAVAALQRVISGAADKLIRKGSTICKHTMC